MFCFANHLKIYKRLNSKSASILNLAKHQISNYKINYSNYITIKPKESRLFKDELQGKDIIKMAFSTLTSGPSPLQQIPSPEAVVKSDETAVKMPISPESNIQKPEALRFCRAVYRKLPISSKKLTLVAKVVRKLHVHDALLQCDVIHKKAARIVRNAIVSARANGANNHGLDSTKLHVSECYVTKGTPLKRIKIHAKGRSGKMKRYRSHLTVILKEDEKSKIRNKSTPSWIDREEMKAKNEKPKKKVWVGCPPGWYRKKVNMDYKSINARRKLMRKLANKKVDNN